jgi:HTH-type transcriptional regulator/antitoxin MqsA
MARRMPTQLSCPGCGGQMTRATRKDRVAYKGQETTVRVRGDFCDRCGEAVFEGPALEVRENAFLALRAKVEGVLGPAEVAAIREKLRLSQRQAGQLLGGGPRAFQKYESGEQQVSVPMANLLRLLARDPRRLRELPGGVRSKP